MRASFSHEMRTSLPGHEPRAFKAAPDMGRAFELNRDPLVRRQWEEARKSEAQRRGSDMVRQDAPRPAPRPKPSLARTPEGQVFAERWQAERAAASKAERKAAFFKARMEQSPAKDRAKSRAN